MAIVVFVAGVAVALALFLSIRGVFTARHRSIQAALVSSPGKSLAVGVVTALALFGFFIGLQASGVPPLRLISVIIAAGGSIAVLFGLAAVAASLGERVLALRDRGSSEFAQTAVGTIVLAVLGAAPLLGWFLIAPISALLGLGAVVISATRRSANGGAAA
ncbi:MAG: hypothetical protein V3V35_03710 [Dehalococcoidia bacterium]